MFQGTGYFPALTTKLGELLAYEQSSQSVKNALVPLLTMVRYADSESFAEAASSIAVALEGRQAIVDFDTKPRKVTSLAEAAEQRRRKNLRKIELGGKEARPRSPRELANDAERLRRTEVFNAALESLADPVFGPRRWLDLIGPFHELVPVLRLTGSESLRTQILWMREARRPAAIRIRVGEAEELAMVMACSDTIAASAADIVLIIDSGNIWGRVDNMLTKTRGTLRDISAAVGVAFDRLTKIVVSTAFPRQPLRSVPSVLPISDRAFSRTLADEFEVRFGDYGSLPNRTDDTPARGFLPHVDLVTPDSWHVHLYEENRNARRYVDAARDASGSEEWGRRADCWGSSVIEQVARGNQVIDGRSFTHPSPWLSVRVNQHLAQMTLHRR